MSSTLEASVYMGKNYSVTQQNFENLRENGAEETKQYPHGDGGCLGVQCRNPGCCLWLLALSVIGSSSVLNFEESRAHFPYGFIHYRFTGELCSDAKSLK